MSSANQHVKMLMNVHHWCLHVDPILSVTILMAPSVVIVYLDMVRTQAQDFPGLGF